MAKGNDNIAFICKFMWSPKEFGTIRYEKTALKNTDVMIIMIKNL